MAPMKSRELDELRARLESETSPRLHATQSKLHEDEWHPEARMIAAEILARGEEGLLLRPSTFA